MKQRRSTPRRRVAPRWTPLEWTDATLVLLARSGSRCECCGELLHGRAERHHRKRRRDGGDRLANLALLIPEHHHRITLRPAWAVSRGLIVPVALDVLEEPIWYQGRGWMLLDDEGGMEPTDLPHPI